MKKELLLIYVISFIIGLLIGVLMIEDIQTNLVPYVWSLHLLVVIGGLLVVNSRYKRVGFKVFLYPTIVFIIYFPINLLAGYNLDSINRPFSYYGSYPRFYILIYYALFLFGLYLCFILIDSLLKMKYTKVVFVVADIVSLIALPFLAIATYFVSPH